MKDTIGSVCIKEEVKGTEYECACQTCSSPMRGMTFDLLPLYDEETEERIA